MLIVSNVGAMFKKRRRIDGDRFQKVSLTYMDLIIWSKTVYCRPLDCLKPSTYITHDATDPLSDNTGGNRM